MPQTIAPLPLTPENWMNDKLTHLLGNGKQAVDWSKKIMSLANWTPLGIPQAGYDAGQMMGRGAQQVQSGNTMPGLAQAGLGGLMGAMAIGPGPKVNFGKGWFMNIKNGKIHEMAQHEMGPHGDHDGWIAIGDNAEKLGIDPVKAKAFQEATYGKYTPSGGTIHEGFQSDPGQYPGQAEEFKKQYGMDWSDAAEGSVSFPELVRMRHYTGDNGGTLVIDHPLDRQGAQKILPKLQDFVAKMDPQPGKVVMSGGNSPGSIDGDKYRNFSIDDFYNTKWLRD